MSQPIVAAVQRFEEPSGEHLADANLISAPSARVVLDGATYLIDSRDPRYPAWSGLLRRREDSRKPLYAEAADGERITRLEVPRARRVAEIFPIPELRGAGVRLSGSPMLLYLPFDRFERLFDILRSAEEQGSEVLITVDPDTQEILDARPFAAPAERAALLASLTFPPFPGLPDEILTVRQIVREFEFLASQAEIPFDYPKDCCTARAHAMFGLLRSRGFHCRKIWNYGGGGVPSLSMMRFFTLRDPKGFVTWIMHVALLVKVRLGYGDVVDMVLDPAMFNHPVRIPEWVALQHDSTALQQIADPEIFDREVHGTRSERDDDFFLTRDWLDDHMDSRNPKPPPLG